MQSEPKRSNKTVLIVLVLAMSGLCLCSCPIVAAIVFPVFSQARESARQTGCLANLKQIGLAALIYSQDYQERFPPANQWGDLVQPYVSRHTAFRCPSVPEDKFGYAMNSKLSRLPIKKLAQPEQTPLMYDSTNLEWNAHDAVSSMPDPPRHGGTVNNVAYADGSARAKRASSP